ncbi:MAG: hypothetical protein WC827_03670 [Candidatus Paceibacterota bacterium]|jgi:hypothetical protein
MKDKKLSLFSEEETILWKKEWQGMPEFIQKDLTPFRIIKVSFRSKEDVAEFAKLMNQKLTAKTRSIWFPKVQWRLRSKKYVDE